MVRILVKVLDESGQLCGELVIEVPEDIPANRLVGALRQQRPGYFDSAKDYVVYVLKEGDQPLLTAHEGAVVIIKPKPWDSEVRIVEEKPGYGKERR